MIASRGGFPKHAAWFHNLMAHPDTVAQIGSERRSVHALVAETEERERLWAKAVRMYQPYEDYRAPAGREIPVVVLERR